MLIISCGVAMLTVFATAWFVVGEPSTFDVQCRITTSSSSTTTRPSAPKPPAPVTDEPKTTVKAAAEQISEAPAAPVVKSAA